MTYDLWILGGVVSAIVGYLHQYTTAMLNERSIFYLRETIGASNFRTVESTLCSVLYCRIFLLCRYTIPICSRFYHFHIVCKQIPHKFSNCHGRNEKVILIVSFFAFAHKIIKLAHNPLISWFQISLIYYRKTGYEPRYVPKFTEEFFCRVLFLLYIVASKIITHVRAAKHSKRRTVKAKSKKRTQTKSKALGRKRRVVKTKSKKRTLKTKSKTAGGKKRIVRKTTKRRTPARTKRKVSRR